MRAHGNIEMIPEDLANQQAEDLVHNNSNNRMNVLPNNPGQLQQQQPFFGAHLNFPRSNLGNAGPGLVHQRSGPIDGGINHGNQGINLVYGFQNAVHAGSYLPQQRSNPYLPH